ncbi:YhgE/Pip family protein [Sporosarcina cyprini]|uniref:YhgE/Pip family protein n=1 Tax=Sporosarcina cyprini TaxID=2910523 RepID=UPI001EE05824|nr:YhgE/Pip domain-containing protein [Sporosarcina cyprini]
MRKSWSIYMADLKNLSRNWVAAVIIGGLIILPSLYAWLNIYASWDPYANTDQLPVAVVNEDKGATIRDEPIDVGGQLVDNLKHNRDMDWNFTTREQAMDGIEYGDYFAVLIIPENFSERLGTVISGEPEKSQIDYYVNEKLNSIAPKITEKGASVIVEKVSSQFIATVDEVIFDLFNQLGVEIQKDLPDIERFEQYIFDVEQKLPEIHETLVGTRNDAKSARQLIRQAQNKMPAAKQTVSEGLGTIDRTLGFLNQAEARLNEMAPTIQRDLNTASRISKETNDFLTKVGDVQIDFTELDQVKERVDTRMTNAIGKVEAIQADLVWLRDRAAAEEGDAVPANPERDKRLQDAIDRTGEIIALMTEAQTNARALNGLVEGKEQQLKQTLADLQDISGRVSVRLDQFIAEYEQTIEPTVRSEVKRAKATLQQGRSMLIEIQTTIPEVERVLASTSTHLEDGQGMLDQVMAEYPYVSEKVKSLANRIREVKGETDINEIIQLLQNDPQAERSFFEEPIVLNENKLFPIKNYGTGMTPFYTVLSIWVGCLLLISLLSTDAENHEEMSARQVYVGKLMTFLTIGFLQTIIVTVGDLTLLGVKANNPAWFIVFGLFISVIFMTLVYTLVTLFGDVGKALAIILLVLQIAGSGGTYPVMLLPEFFQWINPGLPFTYAIDLMREAVGGIVWRRVMTDFTFLLITGVAIFIVGYFLKEMVNRKTHQLLRKSRESGLFH